MRSAFRHGQPDHFATPTALQCHLEFADQVFRLFLEFQVTVAKHAKGAVPDHLVARKQPVEMKEQQFLQGNEPMHAILCRKRHETLDLGGHRQERAQRPLVRPTAQFQRKRVSFVRNERERVRRIDGQRRQDREDLIEEEVFEVRLVPLGQFLACQQADSVPCHFRLQRLPDLLMHVLQPTRVGVDQDELLGGRQAVRRRCRVPGMRKLAQPGHAHGVEFVQVCRGDRQEPQPFQERNARILRFFQYAPVEGEPRQFPVDETVWTGEVLPPKLLWLGHGG